MEALLAALVILVSAAMTGLFLLTVWRFVLMPSLEGVHGVRRAVVFLAILSPGVAPFVLVLFELSDRQALLVIATLTFIALGIGLVVGMTGRRDRVNAARDRDHE